MDEAPLTGAVTAVQVGSSPRCRSCHASIWFGLTEKSRRMPLDPGSVEDGNVVIVTLEGRMETEVANLGRARAQRANAGDAELPRVRTLRNGEHVPADLPRYVSHFVTCPEAQSHRRSKTRASATPAERGASSAVAPRSAGIGGAR